MIWSLQIVTKGYEGDVLHEESSEHEQGVTPGPIGG